MDNLAAQNSRNREIDLFRFVAAFAVLLYHYTYAFPRIDPSFPFSYSLGRVFRYGYLAVDLFFIISGYVIMLSAHGKTARQFIQSRVIRLYPVYWISCLLTFGLLSIGSALSSRATHVPIIQLLFNLTMFQEFFGYPSISSVYWTLSYELSFYILVLLIIGFNGWNYLIYFLTAWLAYTFIAGPVANNSYFSAVFIPKYSAHFIAGILFYLIRQKMFAAWKLDALLGLSFIAVLRSARRLGYELEGLYHDYFNFMVIAAILGLIFFAFWWIAVYRPDFSRQTFFSTLGALTYPLYLLQGVGAVLFYAIGSRVNSYIMLVLVTGFSLFLAWLAAKAEWRVRKGWKWREGEVGKSR